MSGLTEREQDALGPFIWGAWIGVTAERQAEYSRELQAVVARIKAAADEQARAEEREVAERRSATAVAAEHHRMVAHVEEAREERDAASERAEFLRSEVEQQTQRYADEKARRVRAEQARAEVVARVEAVLDSTDLVASEYSVSADGIRAALATEPTP